MSKKPNIFRLATKELSQDGFFTWLLQWADNEHRKHCIELNETAKDFVRLLLGQPADYSVNKVEAGRQWQRSIDIWAEVNDEFFIGIEDKTNTGEHSGQLENYIEIATAHYKEMKHKLVFIYLKTGNESLSALNKIKEKGYSVIDRKAILHVLNKRSISNEIFNDFLNYLTEIENQTNSYDKLENITSVWKTGEGFYLKLQEHISEGSDWEKIYNPIGSFLGFYYHETGTAEINKIYIQIENAFENGIKLVIKIADWDQSIDTMYRVLDEIRPFAENNSLAITKPNKFRAGGTSTLAIVQDSFKSDNNGNFDFNGFLTKLKLLEKTLDEYCEMKRSAQSNNYSFVGG